jgi:polysaccharide export outer membrane protein
MRGRANHSIRLGLFLVAISASLLGQAPATSGANPKPAPASTKASPAPSPAPAATKAHDDSFIIGNDDFLAIDVWKEPEVSRSLPVRSDGRISLPLVGEVQATGRTPLQLEQEIADKLRAYIKEPEVTVMVQQINSEKFNILGQVSKPGSYPLTLATTVLDAIAAAGGFRDFAKQKSIYILRQNANGGESRILFNYKDVIKGKDPEQNVKLQPNDTVVVP